MTNRIPGSSNAARSHRRTDREGAGWSQYVPVGPLMWFIVRRLPRHTPPTAAVAFGVTPHILPRGKPQSLAHCAVYLSPLSSRVTVHMPPRQAAKSYTMCLVWGVSLFFCPPFGPSASIESKLEQRQKIRHRPFTSLSQRFALENGSPTLKRGGGAQQGGGKPASSPDPHLPPWAELYR